MIPVLIALAFAFVVLVVARIPYGRERAAHAITKARLAEARVDPNERERHAITTARLAEAFDLLSEALQDPDEKEYALQKRELWSAKARELGYKHTFTWEDGSAATIMRIHKEWPEQEGTDPPRMPW